MADLGKIQHQFFEENILSYCGRSRPEVLCGPSFGVDVSVVNLGHNQSLISTSDPLSLVPALGLKESAWLSVHLMANDMATTGFAPQYAQFVLNLPANFPKEDFNVYWQYIHQFCEEIGVAITGGHTGFIEGQNSTIAGGGTFNTVAPTDQIRLSTQAKAGQVILLTKQSALTATSILAKSFPETIKNKLGNEIFEQAESLFYSTSSLKDALAAVKAGGVTAMHDVTEGGMLGAIYELAVASGNGVSVDHAKLPIGEAQRQVCGLFSIDPRYVVGAGSMLIIAEKGKQDGIIEALAKEDILCSEVGELLPKEAGLKIVENNEVKELIYLEKDPYWAAFFEALKLGWA